MTSMIGWHTPEYNMVTAVLLPTVTAAYAWSTSPQIMGMCMTQSHCITTMMVRTIVEAEDIGMWLAPMREVSTQRKQLRTHAAAQLSSEVTDSASDLCWPADTVSVAHMKLSSGAYVWLGNQQILLVAVPCNCATASILVHSDAAQAQHAQHAGGHSQLSASSQAQHAQYDSKSARGAEALQAAEGAQSASHTQSHQRAGSQNSSSTAPESDLESHQGSSPAQPMSPQPKLTPNLEGSDAQSTDSTQAQPASVDQQQRLAPEADQKQKLMPAPHLQPQQQQLGQQQQQQQQQRRQQLMAQLLSSKRMMPPSFPLVDDVRCVLGGRQQLSMLDSLQGLMAGLVVKALTSQVWTPHANLQLLRLTAAQTYSCSDTFPRACCMRASS
ncbi:hypothetical protein MMC14_009138 [Varicellaria rhodocarpa]|nr:hypothetical protein [Varicellaria rhodocarpa]